MMEVEYLIKKYNADEYVNLATENLLKSLQRQAELLNEIHVRDLSELIVIHKETSLVFFSTAYDCTFVKFTLHVESLRGERKGYYEFIIDLNDRFLDEFLVFH